MENKIKGFGALSNNGEPYEFYRDKWVEVITQNETCWGKYQGMKEGYLILRPHLRVESYPSQEEKERKRIFILVDEPKTITGGIINSVDGIREGYVMAHVSNRMIIFPRKD